MELIGYVVYGIYVLTILWLFFNAIMQLHLLWLAKKKKPSIAKSISNNNVPGISIQLPVYNEKYVVEGLLEKLAELDYPKEKFEIQILDDSTDETSAIIKRKTEELRQKGIDVSIIRRTNRNGYKAGALQEGLPYCKGEFIAIFDADFRPPSHFLKSLLPHFTDQKIGLVQARWGHENKEENFLTRIQTILLDTHFMIEQSGRHNAGYFTNFCGTAGIWRKQCIEDAGGWDGTILSEDLELSYRAQLKGWKVIYDESIVVPAEVPSVMEAFKIQQFRWTKGIAQTARKTLPNILQLAMPLGKKLHSIFQLLSSVVFIFLFINALLTIPMLILRNQYPQFIPLTNYTVLGAINLIALTLIHYKGTNASKNDKGFFSYYPLFLIIYLGMSVQNAIAVMQGLMGKPSPFVRTPKTSGSSSHSYLNKKISWLTILEILMLIYFLSGILLSFWFEDYFLLFFFMMMCGGLGLLVYKSLEQFYIQPSINKRLSEA